jgi:hypothetical protein
VESVRQIGLSRQVGQEDLYGLDPVRNDIADLEDLAHPPGAEDCNDLIVADGAAPHIDNHRRNLLLVLDGVPDFGPSEPLNCHGGLRVDLGDLDFAEASSI